VGRLDKQLEAVAHGVRYRQQVGWLCCLRGVQTVTAMTILSELHGFERFESPRQLMAYLGLVPSEQSSGERQSRGGITKTGNSHVRRILIEAAWHSRHRPLTSSQLRRRRQGQPAWAVALAEKAQARLHDRYRRLTARGKNRNKVVVAIARELVGFLWAMLRPRPETAIAA
jgi:transposase